MLTRILTLVVLAVLASAHLGVARADTVLVSSTTMISGSQSDVFSFTAPGPGTITAQITNLSWPQPLDSLSVIATSGKEVMGQWSVPVSQTGSFQIGSSGTYYADVLASAGGALHLGVYSLEITFTPQGAPVPLPAGVLLLAGGFSIVVLLHFALTRRRPRAATPPPPPRAQPALI
ncbi:MAG: hypothetical protein JSS29_12205 [Proteobacteria bacterium]|nr:hypothetical protein [Pseudomonadota bacterium]